jgi:flagellar protein FliO/FliZ
MSAGRALIGLVLGHSGIANAADPTSPISITSTLQVVLGLLLVIGMIIGAMWLLRRLTPGAGRPGPVSVISAAAVGQRERVVLVGVHETCLVLGVAPGQVNLLYSLPRSALPATENSSTPRFLDKLAQARSKT